MREENKIVNELTELSKIRKFIFADISSDSSSAMLEAYRLYWLEMENSFFNICNIDLFEKFIFDFITIQKNGVLPRENELMSDFVNYYMNACKYQKKELVLRNIYRYSVYFLKICFGEIQDNEIKAKIDEINALDANDAYPFLMEVFEDYDYAHINKNMLLDILDTVIGFVYDRNSQEPSPLAVSFAGLSNEINKMMILKDYVPKFTVEEISRKENTINTLNAKKG